MAAIEFITSLGTEETEHAGDTSFMQHLTETRDYLERWGCAPVVCDVGLLHSIYGTESFQPEASVPITARERVRAVVGDRCEHLCFVNCVMVRQTFDAAVAELCSSGLRGVLHTTEALADAPQFRIGVREGDPSDAVVFDPATGARHASLPPSFHMSQREFVDLATMSLADWLQQVT